MSSSPSSEPDRWLPAGGNSSVARGEGKLRGACFSGASFTGVVAPRGAAPGAARLLAVAPFVLFELLAKVVGGKGASGSVGLTSNMPASASDCCCRNNVGEDRGVSWRNDSKSASGESRLPRGDCNASRTSQTSTSFTLKLSSGSTSCCGLELPLLLALWYCCDRSGSSRSSERCFFRVGPLRKAKPVDQKKRKRQHHSLQTR